MVFAWFSRLNFPICLTMLCTPIPTIFFSCFLTWGFHSHFIKVKYITRGPIGKNVVCPNSLLQSSPYNYNPPYLCFLFVGGWYTYIRYWSNVVPISFMIAIKNFNIKAFNATSEMCSLVSMRVGPLYKTSFWFFLFLTRIFIFWVHQWDPNHSLNYLWLKLFMKILKRYLISLSL